MIRAIKVIYESLHCLVVCVIGNKIIYKKKRFENIYVVDINKIDNDNVKCFSALLDSSCI
jgi:hypothetical protein